MFIPSELPSDPWMLPQQTVSVTSSLWFSYFVASFLFIFSLILLHFPHCFSPFHCLVNASNAQIHLITSWLIVFEALEGNGWCQLLLLFLWHEAYQSSHQGLKTWRGAEGLKKIWITPFSKDTLTYDLHKSNSTQNLRVFPGPWYCLTSRVGGGIYFSRIRKFLKIKIYI